MNKKNIKEMVDDYVKEELYNKKNMDVLKRLSKK